MSGIASQYLRSGEESCLDSERGEKVNGAKDMRGTSAGGKGRFLKARRREGRRVYGGGTRAIRGEMEQSLPLHS